MREKYEKTNDHFSDALHGSAAAFGSETTGVRILNHFPKFSADIFLLRVDTITANTETKQSVKGESLMRSNNRIVVPEAKDAMNKFKMEAANEVGVDLKQGYNGHLTSREAGSVGGQMVKKMIESYENKLKSEQ